MQEAVFAALTCVVRVQCVLCGDGPVESGRCLQCSGLATVQPRREERTEGACFSVPSLLSLQPVRTLLEDREGG